MAVNIGGVDMNLMQGIEAIFNSIANFVASSTSILTNSTQATGLLPEHAMAQFHRMLPQMEHGLHTLPMQTTEIMMEKALNL